MTAIIGLVTKFGAVLQLGKILWNAPKIYKFMSRFSDVGKHLIKEKRLPSNQESVDFMRASADLIRAKVIDFPGVEENDIAKVIEELASEMELKKAA